MQASLSALVKFRESVGLPDAALAKDVCCLITVEKVAELTSYVAVDVAISATEFCRGLGIVACHGGANFALKFGMNITTQARRSVAGTLG